MIVRIIGLFLLVCLASNSSLALSKDNLIELIKSSITAPGYLQYPDSEVEIEVYNFNHLLDVEISQFDLKNIDQRNRSFSGIIEYIQHNKKLKKNISGKYNEFLVLPVLNRMFKKGEIISEKDIGTMRLNASNLKKNTISSPEDIIGKTPRSIIMPNHIINAMDIDAALMVEKGKMINLNYYNNNVSIKMPVQAMESGAIGEVIKVKNLKSNSILSAVVSDRSNVTIMGSHHQ